MKKYLLFILILIPYFSYSQLVIDLTADKTPIYPSDGDTLSVCRDTSITFTARATSGGTPVTGATYKWSSDDISQTIPDNTTATFIFNEGGGYRVRLDVKNGVEEEYTIVPVKVAFPPNFSATKTDIPEDWDGICKGSQVALTGKAVPVLWEDEPVYTYTEPNTSSQFSDTNPYTQELPFNEFPVGETFDGGDDIDSIRIKLEHSDMGNVQVKLTCPDGSSIVLKDYYNTNHSDLGNPEEGTGYNYYWSAGATSGLMNTHSPAGANTYLPEESFTGLNGCPLNGKWEIEVSDNAANDDGSVFSWTIFFAEEVLPEIWTFKDTLKNYYNHPTAGLLGTYWTGVNISATSLLFSGDTIIGNATVIPDRYLNNPDTFFVVNDWGCPQDTSINIIVEEPSFTATEQSGAEANTEDVEFENTTSWRTLSDWDFGDNTENGSGDTISHLYQEKGIYTALLTVYDDSGCYDTTSLEIEIVVEKSKLPLPNVFSPNEDGINDYYILALDSATAVKGMREFRMDIYNRWGEKMYTTNSQEEAAETGWDGTMLTSKIKASPGVYFYIIKAKGKDDEEYEEKGTLHLFR